MIDLIAALYDWDPFRFLLWDVLATIGLDEPTRAVLARAGFTVWEDHSISR